MALPKPGTGMSLDLYLAHRQQGHFEEWSLPYNHLHLSIYRYTSIANFNCWAHTHTRHECPQNLALQSSFQLIISITKT